MKHLYAALLVLVLLLSGCAGTAGQNAGSTTPPPSETDSVDANMENMVSFTDDLGRSLEIAVHPQRVAVLIGSFADIWCLAGGKDTMVAAASDSWTSFDLELPESVSDLGSVKDPNLEILLSCEPDFIIASCNTSADVELLETFEASNIPTAYFDVENVEDYLRMLKICTDLTGCTENYDLYGTQMLAQVEEAIARQDDSHPTVLYVRASSSSCKVKGSEGNVLGEMLAAMGCINIADQDGSLLEDLSLEAIIAADPDYIFAVLQSADPSVAMETLQSTLLSNPAWDSLRAVQEGRFHTMEHRLYNLKPNARWGEAYEKLADILYPNEAE